VKRPWLSLRQIQNCNDAVFAGLAVAQGRIAESSGVSSGSGHACCASGGYDVPEVHVGRGAAEGDEDRSTASSCAAAAASTEGKHGARLSAAVTGVSSITTLRGNLGTGSDGEVVLYSDLDRCPSGPSATSTAATG
jgi:hypothetical protein